MTKGKTPRAKPLKWEYYPFWKYYPHDGWKKGKALGLCNGLIEAIVYRAEKGWLWGGVLYETEKSAKDAAEEYHQAKWLAIMDAE